MQSKLRLVQTSNFFFFCISGIDGCSQKENWPNNKSVKPYHRTQPTGIPSHSTALCGTSIYWSKWLSNVSSLNHSCVEIACMENHNFNIFISPETGNISIIPMFIILKTMELWCYKKVVDTSDLTQKTVTISNYEGRGNPALKKG
jgi:hypothetical protein